ncbi:MAG: hypothetical protein K6G11_06375, partial [Lachnospiraceae bacterium]|nr:hypothetical protein [Lachnospiraceae bacterium]
MRKKLISFIVTFCMIATFSNVDFTPKSAQTDAEPATQVKYANAAATTNLSQIDMSAWSYNSSSDVYYQTGISYCESPADSSYETLGIYIPGAFMNATANSDGS